MSTTPMTPTQWLAALEAEGVDVAQPYSGWRDHERDDETGKAFGPVNGVVVHHTAGRNSLALCYNGTSSLPGPLCHTHLSKTAVASMLSAGRANHAGSFAQNAHNAVLAESPVHPYPDSAEPVDGNDHYYGIEIENLGDGEDPYPLVQYRAAVKWATAICRFHGWSQDSVIGHKEGTRRKIDPKGPVEGGALFTMDRFRTHVKEALALPAGVWPEQEEDVALSAEDIEKVADRVVAKMFAADVVPAVAPPDSNDDWDTNKTWSFKYAVHTPIVTSREALRRVKAIEEKVNALAVGGVDMDALAVKVANEIYNRMAG